MSQQKKYKYTAIADGWVAGKWRAKGSPVELTEKQAKYENVRRATDAGPKVELTGSLDDPIVRSSGLAEKAKDEAAKRLASKSPGRKISRKVSK